MLNNQELETLKTVSKALQTYQQLLMQMDLSSSTNYYGGLINRVEAIITKYELVRTKLRSKLAISKVQLEDWRNDGLSVRQIAKQANCSRSAIERLIHVYGLTGKGGKQEYNVSAIKQKNQID